MHVEDSMFSLNARVDKEQRNKEFLERFLFLPHDIFVAFSCVYSTTRSTYVAKESSTVT